MLRSLPIESRLFRAVRSVLCIGLCFVVLCSPSGSFGDVRVRGHYRNGKYIQPHYRSDPDRSFSNNWSTKGNVNPYTGKLGTRVTPPPKQSAARSPSYSTPSYSPSYPAPSSSFNRVVSSSSAAGASSASTLSYSPAASQSRVVPTNSVASSSPIGHNQTTLPAAKPKSPAVEQVSIPAPQDEVPPWLDKYQRLRQALEIGFQQQQFQRKAEHLSLVKRERDQLNASLEAAKVPLIQESAEADSSDKTELRKVFYASVQEFDEQQRGQAIAAEATFNQTQIRIASALADARKKVQASRLADWDRVKQRENAVWLDVHAKLNKQRAARDADEREKFIAVATQKVQNILAARQQRRRTEQEQAIAQLESQYAAKISDRIAQLEAVFQTNEEEKSRTHAEQLDELRQELIADSKQSGPNPRSTPEEKVQAVILPAPEPAVSNQPDRTISSSAPTLVSVDWPGFKLAVDQRIVTFGSLVTALLLLLRLAVAHRTYRFPEPDEFASAFPKQPIRKG